MQKYEPQNDDDFDSLNLFERASNIAAYERRCAQREELHRISTTLGKMFQSLSDELLLNREGALAMMAEYTGIFDDFIDRINVVRDGDHGRSLDMLAEKLAQGLQYLIGCFTAHQPSRTTWRLDRAEIKGSLQRVWPALTELDHWYSRGRTNDGPSVKSFPKAA